VRGRRLPLLSLRVDDNVAAHAERAHAFGEHSGDAGVGLADAAAFDRAAHKAERNCPVSRALQGNVEIRVHATLDEPSVDGA
jgi:organic hydroperoxide reductase OsmC/OhrA